MSNELLWLEKSLAGIVAERQRYIVVLMPSLCLLNAKLTTNFAVVPKLLQPHNANG